MNNLKLNEALLKAIQEGDFRKAQYIINIGGSIYSLKWRTNQVLEKGKGPELEFYVNKIIDLEEKDEHFGGATPLMRAVRYGNIDAVKMLIKKGVNIEAKNKQGTRALYQAVLYEKKEIIEYLIDNGADINATNGWDGNTALHLASHYKKSKEIVNILLDKGAEHHVKHQSFKYRRSHQERQSRSGCVGIPQHRIV